MNYRHIAALGLATILIAACGGGETSAPTETPTPAPTPVPVACSAAPISATGYSLVFKGCDVSNVATYYDKSECVRDNASGRIWEGKSANASALNYFDRYFLTNFDSSTLLQYRNSTTTVISAPTASQLNDVYNTQNYKNAVNAVRACGFSDWRLPSKDELLSIVDRTRPAGEPTINATWFPVSSNRLYWSSTPGASDYQAWYVYFTDGSANYHSRTLQPIFVRLVR